MKDLKYFKEKIAKLLFKQGYFIETREFPGHPENEFGSLVQFNINSNDLSGAINFYSNGQIEIDGIWSKKKNQLIFNAIFFDAYKEVVAQEKLKEFILCLLPDYKIE